MKKLLFFSFIFTLLLSATSNAADVSVEDQIKLSPVSKINSKDGFKITEIKKDSIYHELGYKKGQIIKKLDGKLVSSASDLQSGLKKQAQEWDNTNFDDSFIDAELELEAKSFEEIEKEFM